MSLLDIYIPTIGRDELAEVLASIELDPRVRVYVSDNTGDAGPPCAGHPDVDYRLQGFDIGRDANVLRACGVGDGEWVWVLGDDDPLLPGAVGAVCEALLWSTEPLAPGLDRLIVLTPEAVEKVPAALGRWAWDTPSFVEALRPDLSLLIAATLCSANIFRREILDLAKGLQHFDSYYGYAHASVGAMTTRVLREPVFRCGWWGQTAIPDHLRHWQTYLDALSEATGANPISVNEASGWNFASLARNAARMNA